MNLTDEALVDRFRSTKEPRYFALIVGRYQNRVYNAAYRIVDNAHEAEEVVQETFLRVLQNLDAFQGRSPFGAWLFAITHNLCMDVLRNRRRKNSYQVVSFDPQAANGEESNTMSVSVVSQIADPKPGPAMLLDGIEEQNAIKASLNKLPDSQREVLVLHDIEGFSYQEIASITQVSIGTVRSRLHYGREKMRELLNPYFSQTALAPQSR